MPTQNLRASKASNKEHTSEVERLRELDNGDSAGSLGHHLASPFATSDQFSFNYEDLLTSVGRTQMLGATCSRL